MKAVLISIQPKWVKKIASGRKTIEVRKSRPKLETPFKCYIYETKGKKVECGFHFEETGRTLREKYVFGLKEARIVKHYCDEGHCKIIGEFVCDKIYEIKPYFDRPDLLTLYECGWKYGEEFDCLSFSELNSYLGENDGFGWHISDLKIYDKPKELSEFWAIKCTNKRNGCQGCKVKPNCIKTITRPPQSYMFVESLGE
jgi:predicted transcriptional regulator